MHDIFKLFQFNLYNYMCMTWSNYFDLIYLIYRKHFSNLHHQYPYVYMIYVKTFLIYCLCTCIVLETSKHLFSFTASVPLCVHDISKNICNLPYQCQYFTWYTKTFIFIYRISTFLYVICLTCLSGYCIDT